MGYCHVHPLLVARIAVKSIGPAEIDEAELHGLLAYVGVGRKLERHELEFHGLLAQSLRDGRSILLRPGSRVLVVGEADPPYCRWHDGSLHGPDDPLRRRYCMRRTSTGYCDEHADSLRALYEACVIGWSLDACKKVDEELGAKLKYTIYMAAHGGRKVKVGLTRSFRFLDRLAEQYHLVATVIFETDSLLEARKVEMKLSRRAGVSDKGPRKIGGEDRQAAADLLARAAEDAAKGLGIDWRQRMLYVRSPGKLPAPGRPGMRSEYKIAGYSQGFLLLNGPEGVISVKPSRIAHRLILELLGR